MRSGARNTKESWTREGAPFAERFSALLREEVDLFRELDGIQAQALGCARGGAFGNLEGLMARQREVLLRLEERRNALQPLMETWEKLPGAERAALRGGPIGDLLQAVEAAAGVIQKRHSDHFDAAPESDLALRVSRWRAGP